MCFLLEDSRTLTGCGDFLSILTVVIYITLVTTASLGGCFTVENMVPPTKGWGLDGRGLAFEQIL